MSTHTIQPWHWEAAKALHVYLYGRDPEEGSVSGDICRNMASRIAEHEPNDNTTERCATCGTAWSPSLIESGECIFCTCRALKAQHAETVRLLREAIDQIESGEQDTFGLTAFQENLCKEIRAHLARVKGETT